MTTKHEGFTPGPWTTDQECGHEMVLGPDGHLVADCAIILPRLRFRPAAENAALVADAPRLYAENQRLRDAMARVAAALDADGRTTDGCTKADAVARLRAALTGDDA